MSITMIVFLCFSLFFFVVFCLLSSLSPWIAFRHCFPEQVPRICVFGFYFRLLRIFHIGLPNRQTAISFDYSPEFPGHDGHGGNGTKTSRKRKKKKNSGEEREREKKNWATKRKLGNQQSKEKRFFFFFPFLVVCVYPIKINLFPCD